MSLIHSWMVSPGTEGNQVLVRIVLRFNERLADTILNGLLG